jgi:hypothetical protein
MWAYSTYLNRLVQRHALPETSADVEKTAEQKALLHKGSSASGADADDEEGAKAHRPSMLQEMFDSAVYRCAAEPP